MKITFTHTHTTKYRVRFFPELYVAGLLLLITTLILGHQPPPYYYLGLLTFTGSALALYIASYNTHITKATP